MKPTIVLVGRPNVGKSTLFNRLTKSQAAIVLDEPGITRDRQIGEGRVGSKPYWIIDTGGFETNSTDTIAQQSIQQTLRAIDEADAVIFLLDVRSGISAEDKTLAVHLRKTQTTVFLVANKAEGIAPSLATAEFYELGLGEPYAISAAHGNHILELMDLILDNFPSDPPEAKSTEGPIIAIIGRPNVGKSTLLNTILGENRLVTSEQPGTTRDSIFVPVTHHQRHYTFIDTAGMRRKSRIDKTLERFSILRTLRAIHEANVAIIMLDAKQMIADQDCAIANLALQAGCALLIVINKWDSVDSYQKTQFKQAILQKFVFLNFARLHYISALQGTGLKEIFRSIDEAYQATTIKLSTPKLTKTLIEAVALQAPSRVGKIIPKPRYAHQGGNQPPTIIIHGNALNRLSANYLRFLENRFRQAFQLKGTPLRIQYKSQHNPYHHPTTKH